MSIVLPYSLHYPYPLSISLSYEQCFSQILHIVPYIASEIGNSLLDNRDKHDYYSPQAPDDGMYAIKSYDHSSLFYIVWIVSYLNIYISAAVMKIRAVVSHLFEIISQHRQLKDHFP